MRRSSILAVALVLLATGCKSNPATGSQTTKVTLTAQLLPSSEVPPVSNAESTGSGSATITFNLTKDSAGNTTAATADFSGNFTGFPAGTSLTAAHIHTGAAGAAGGIYINANVAAGDVTMPNGSGTLSKTGVAVSPASYADAVISNPSGYYFNVHTALNPAGVARGQLVK